MYRILLLAWYSFKFLLNDKIRLTLLFSINVIALSIVLLGVTFFNNVRFNLADYTKNYFGEYWILPKNHGAFLSSIAEPVIQPRIPFEPITSLLNNSPIAQSKAFHITIKGVSEHNSNRTENLVIFGEQTVNKNNENANQISPTQNISISSSFSQFFDISIKDSLRIEGEEFIIDNIVPEQFGAFPQGYITYNGNEHIFKDINPHFVTFSVTKGVLELIQKKVPDTVQIVSASVVADAMFSRYLALELSFMIGLFFIMSGITVYIATAMYLFSHVYKISDIYLYLFKTGSTLRTIISVVAAQLTVFFTVVATTGLFLTVVGNKYFFTQIYENVTIPAPILISIIGLFYLISLFSMIQPMIYLRKIKRSILL